MTSTSSSGTPAPSAAEFLAQRFPALVRYCPNLSTISVPQAAFLLLDAREAFYGGAAGGGKSDALLMAAVQYADVPGYRALLLRRTYAQLSKGDALIPRAHEWLSGTDARWNEQRKTWTFPSGATLEFGHVEHEVSKYDYQGAAFQFVGFDELTQFSESMYDYIGFTRARRRTAMADAGVPIRTRATSNPGGEGHMWVKRRFISERKPDVVFVPAKVSDNPGLDVTEYAASLATVGPELRMQLLEGDWDVFEGQAYPEFREDLHVVEAFPVDPAWERFEFMDHGIANPAAWFVAATDHDGNVLIFDSYYRPGLVSDHCAAIMKRRPAWYPQWVDANGETRRQHADKVIGDPAVTQRTGTMTKWGAPATIATEYQEQSDGAIVLLPGNNDPKAGRARVSEMLKPDPERPFPAWHPRYGDTGAPRLFVVGTSCPELVTQLAGAPLLPIDSGRLHAGEIVDPGWEGPHGHAVAALRYGLMSRPQASPEPPPEEDDPRRELLRKVEEDRADNGRPGTWINV